MTQDERRRRSAEADRLCAVALRSALDAVHGGGRVGRDECGEAAGRVDAGAGPGMALVAVGGYGRRELAPHSDLDVVLVHDEDVDVAGVASRVWYPLWDSGAEVDHSVRALGEVGEAARADPRVALGLLDARHVAGDPSVTLRLRADLLAHWRRDARRQLPALRDLVAARADRLGELAHATVPDLKDAAGGLRDATVLKALVASWLVDVPHTELERSRLQLLDVRDVLHQVAGRATDRVLPELWEVLADGLGLPDAGAAQRQVRELGRRITHLSRLTWHRVDAVLAAPRLTGRRSPGLERVASGVAVSRREVVLDRNARPAEDPLVLLRASAEAAERGLPLAPATAARLAREGAPLPEPWSDEARGLFTRLLAGPGLLAVWETLDETGALDRLVPEWERVRLLPHASTVHRFTVDRHLVETCLEAARLIRRVARPDVLLAAALLHDLGKGGLADHSVAGEPLAGTVAARMGLGDREVSLVRRLVRHHLLLAQVATTRDLEDPETVGYVAERVTDLETLSLLEVLTEADARATAAQAWTPWRAGLVADLVRRVRSLLSGQAVRPGEDVPTPARLPVSEAVRADPLSVDVRVDRRDGATTVTVVSADRTGLMADVAGALAVLRASVRSARAWAQDDLGVSVWHVDDTALDAAVLRQGIEAVVSGRVLPATRLRPRRADLEPSVLVRHEASRRATVLEVRVGDGPGVVHLVCAALARLDLSVRSAHVTTLGPQAVDVFYVQEPGAGALSEERAAAGAHAVRDALQGTVTLDADRG